MTNDLDSAYSLKSTEDTRNLYRDCRAGQPEAREETLYENATAGHEGDTGILASFRKR